MKRTRSEYILGIARPLALIGVAAVTAGLMWSLGVSPVVTAAFAAATSLPLLALLVWRTHRKAWTLLHDAHLRAEQAAEIERHYFEVLRRIITVTDARDKTTAGRNERIGRMSRQIAERMGFDPRRADLLGMAAEVHDIGLLAVPDEVLHKRTRLVSSEFEAVRMHPQIGYEILRPLQFLSDVLPAVRHHHERLNGTGYPAALAGEDIPVEARILAVAESFEALTHDRSHRRAINSSQAVMELVRCADSGFDRACVCALAETVNLGRLLPRDWRAEDVAEPLACPPIPSVIVGV